MAVVLTLSHLEPSLLASFREQARWTESCAVTGQLSGQDGATCILPAQDYLLYRARKISPKAIYIKFLVGQACLVKMAGYWRCSFLEIYGPQLCVNVKICLFGIVTYRLMIICYCWREQANAAAAERSAVDIKLLQDKVCTFSFFCSLLSLLPWSNG